MNTLCAEPSLPYRAEQRLNKLRRVRAGEGVHNLIVHAAMALLPFKEDWQISAALQEAVANCGREVPDREIDEAIESAHRYSDGCVSSRNAAHQKWPPVNAELRKKVIRDAGVNLDGLRNESAISLTAPATEQIIDLLFPDNPLLCIGETKTVFSTRPREAFRGALSSRQFIVPSPMSKIRGLTKAGRPSDHCLDNTGPRKFAVVEFDTGSADEHAALLWHLRCELGAPLVLAVHSGGKSLHGWFYCEGCPEDQVAGFYRYCVSLGADRATYTRSQFVRMPDGIRDGKLRQSVHYFDPTPLKGGSK